MDAENRLLVAVHEERCMGVGSCAMIAPAVFGQRDEDGTVALLEPVPSPDQYGAVEEAAYLCPAAAIHVRHPGLTHCNDTP